MNEEEIINAIADAIQQKVALQGNSRTFEYQTLLTGGVAGGDPLGGPSQKDTGGNKRKARVDDKDEDEIMEDEPEHEERSPGSILSCLAVNVVLTMRHAIRFSVGSKEASSTVQDSDLEDGSDARFDVHSQGSLADTIC